MSNKINYKEYLQSDYWKEIREKVYKRDGYRCRLCNSDENICVHHRTYEFVGNESLDELITLCKRCHKNFHKIDEKLSYWKVKQNKQIVREQENKKFYFDFIEENLERFNYVKNIIITNNYILYKDFEKEIHNILKCIKRHINLTDLYRYIFEYYSLVHASNYYVIVINKYNLPEKKSGRQKEIITTKRIYEKNPKQFILIHHNLR